MNGARAAHPDATRLDALAVGAGDAATKAHVAECGACAAYVDEVAKASDAFAQREGARADDFVRAVRLRERTARAQAARRGWIAGGATVLALAAAALLVVRAKAPAPPDDRVAIAESSEAPVRFKGGVQVAAVIERNGAQSRETGALDLAPGDRVRVEIALDHAARVAAGVLADDGAWAELQPATDWGPGTHYSEHAVAFEGDVPSGWLLVGDDAAVAQARRTRSFDAVTAIRVRAKTP